MVAVAPKVATTNSSQPPIPKISFRRDSLQGPGWIKTPTVAITIPDVNVNSLQSATMTVAGNAVSSMFSAIRATFKPAPDVNTTANTPDTVTVNNPVETVSRVTVPKSTETRASSASRGRGVQRSAKK